jgi:hypothetical protein
MVKKLFALASVTALSGLMAVAAAAGCSSSNDTPPTPDAGAADAKPDRSLFDSAPDDGGRR